MKKLLFTLILAIASSMAVTHAQEVMQIHKIPIGWAPATDYMGNSYTVKFIMEFYVVYSSSNGQMIPIRFEYLSGTRSQIVGGGMLGDYLLVDNRYLTDNGTVAHIDWEWDFQRMGSYYGTGSDSKTFRLRDFPFDPSLPTEPSNPIG